MLAKLLIALIMLFFLINYSNGICLLSSPELFLSGARIKESMFPGITAPLTNSQFLTVYVRVVCYPLFLLYTLMNFAWVREEWCWLLLISASVGAVYCACRWHSLLASSLSPLCLMLNTCSQFATTHSLLFNASKIQLVRFLISTFRPSTLSMQPLSPSVVRSFSSVNLQNY